ncbi:MAG: filamentous hemagglutinin N-terminal domain-containing protein [Nostoc sp.]|uniref:two-partner secretion domain-containing protein n=1 Tax=Nostoc sp. TaxID=1180 RepID=UPI002FFC8798
MNQVHHLGKSSIKIILSLYIISTALSQASPVQAQITPDNTLGVEASRLNQNLIINGGATRGSNLFHSFSEFNIKEGQRVYFTNPAGIENILTRVTGGNASNIFGTLGVDGAANLFLINPNGILFGENARLDVQGSFVGTTANGVQFGNQGVFSATNPKAPELLTIQPSALWFNQLNQNAEIQNNSVAPIEKNLAGFDAFGLRVGDGKSLLLVGGNVIMNRGQLNAYGGRVELGGLAAPGNINLVFNGENLSLKFPLNVTRANVSLSNQAGVFVVTVGGGNIAINARNIEILSGSRLDAGISEGSGTPETVAGNITLNATGEIKVAGSDSSIRSNVKTGAVGNGGNITIDSGDFSLSDRAILSASTSGVGNAGNVTVSARNAISLAGNAYIINRVETGGVGKGKGGNININAASLSLTDGAQLNTSTRSASNTQLAGIGDAGDVNVKVTGAIDIAGQKNGIKSGIRSSVDTGAVGNGGNISIDSGDFSLRDRAEISALIFGVGNAGNVTVSARNTISLAGNAAIVSRVEAGGKGKGGNIDINAASLSLTDGAQLLTSTRSASNTQLAGIGDAGNVNVKVTGAVDIAGEKNGFYSGIRSTVDIGTVGNGGKINIDSGDFSLRDRAQLSASTSGEGNAGNVIVSAKNAVSLAGNAGIFSRVGAQGKGKGGDIEINSPKITLDNQSELNAQTASGNGGNININSDLLLLRRNSQISTSAGTEKLGGDGGNININSRFIVAVPNENSDISANAFTGTGGKIKIDSPQGIFGIESRTIPTQNSDITARSELGVSGVTNINAPDNSFIQNSFTGLSLNVIDTNALIANSCISRGTKRQENSFTITGSGALRYSPGNGFVSPYTTGDVRTVKPTSRPWKKGDPIIEPQGVYRLPNGQLILSRSC